MDIPKQNTDRELFREVEGDYYSPSLHVTIDGLVGINVGGYVYVMSLREWHKRAESFIMTDHEIWKWLEDQKYQTDYEEFGEYKMYYDLDMPKILREFLEYSKNQRTTAVMSN
jgi:hypothetical protein